jgi:hypothetical protein
MSSGQNPSRREGTASAEEDWVPESMRNKARSADREWKLVGAALSSGTEEHGGEKTRGPSRSSRKSQLEGGAAESRPVNLIPKEDSGLAR